CGILTSRTRIAIGGGHSGRLLTGPKSRPIDGPAIRLPGRLDESLTILHFRLRTPNNSSNRVSLGPLAHSLARFEV
ncbi:MAG TPA: hypothetical protein DCF63_12090, partial [Planctomycetaceae bacterium]|nr:hypothetical protein [Planctomycetaceae bacterium]